MTTPGQVRQTEAYFARDPRLTRVLTTDTYYDYTRLDGGARGLVATAVEAVRLGVDAVRTLFPWNLPRRAGRPGPPCRPTASARS